MDFGSLMAIYDRLSPIVPSGVDNKLNQTDEQGNSILNTVLYTNRIKSYFYACRQRQKHKLVVTTPGTGSRVVTTTNLLESCTIEPLESLRYFAPLEVQSLNALLNFLITKPSKFAEFTASLLSSQQTQSASTTTAPYGNIIVVDDSASVLADLENNNNSCFWYLTTITIPSIFSFFSTREATTLAFNFYIALSRMISYEIFLVVVEPFFGSAAITHFSDIVFRELFWSNYLSKPAPTAFAQKLIDITAEKISYLPGAQVALLRLLKIQWSNDEIWGILIRNILIPQFTLQSNLCPFSYIKEPVYDCDKIINVLLTKNNKDLNFPNLSFLSSVYEIPDTFIAYGQSFSVDMVLTLADIQCLRTLPIDLPHHMKRIDHVCTSYSNIPLFNPWKIRLFPKIPQPPSFPLRSLLFTDPIVPTPPIESDKLQLWAAIMTVSEERRYNPVEILMDVRTKTGEPFLDDKLGKIDLISFKNYALQLIDHKLTSTAALFEQLLVHQMHLSDMKKWNELSKESSHIESFVIAYEYYSLCSRKKEFQIIQSFISLLNEIPFVSSVRFWYTIMVFSKIEATIMKPFKSEILAMNRNFLMLVEQKKRKIRQAPTFESKVILKYMWEANGLLSLVNHSSTLIARYFSIVTYISEIEKIAKAGGFEDSNDQISDLVHFSIATGDCCWILETVIFLQSLLFSDLRFTEMIDRQLAEMWNNFTVVFIRFLSDDVDLVTAYASYANGEKLKDIFES